jgi:hypothetical protein
MTDPVAPSFAAFALRPAPIRQRPRLPPTAIVAARARHNGAGILVRSRYAVKPPLLVAVEYSVGIASLGAAAYLLLGI